MKSNGTYNEQHAQKIVNHINKKVLPFASEKISQNDIWHSNSNGVYLLSSLDKKIINKKIIETIKSSVNNNEAIWQISQADQALDELDRDTAGM